MKIHVTKVFVNIFTDFHCRFKKISVVRKSSEPPPVCITLRNKVKGKKKKVKRSRYAP
jgi:hypothetical protein